MDISSIAKASSTEGSSAARSQENLDQTYNDFLLLLTTQLKNQDPTSPMETNEFTQQLASLSSVQEQVNMNKNLEQLVSLVGNSQLNNVVSYIGRVVEAKGDQSMVIEDGGVFTYDLAFAAAEANITISDASGRAVFTGPAQNKAGRNEVVWDSKNSFSQSDMPPGAYTFAINAKDSAGQPIDVTTYTTGIVTAVDMENGSPVLEMGEINVPVDDVTSIRTAQELL